MALPAQVKIGLITYDITYDPRCAADSLLGRIALLEGKIEIRPDMSPTVERITLWHEIMHGILFQVGIKEHEERVLDALAHGILQLIEDNPALVGKE